MPSNILDYLDALTGAGKTRAIVRHAHRLARSGLKVLVVQPSKLLIDKTVEKELAVLSPIRHRIIHGDKCNNVTEAVVAHFKTTEPGGEVLFITHSAFFRVPYFHRAKLWIVLMDEVPEVFRSFEFNLPDNRDLLLPHLRADAYDAQYAELTPTDGGGRRRIRAIARNEDRDDVWNTFQGFAATVVSPHWATFVDHSQFETLRSGSSDTKRLCAYSLLQPSVFDNFARVMIAGACFKDSLLYRVWRIEGVKFLRQRMQLRYEKHNNGRLLNIFYATEEAWSKSLRDRQVDDQTVLDTIIKRTADELGDDPFLWLGNKDLPDNLFSGGAMRLPNSPHGLNGYQHVHNTVVLSALNPTPGAFSFLESRGLSSDEVRTAIYRQAVYQAVARSSLRDPECPHPKKAIVPDKETAEWLSHIYVGAQVAPLAGQPLCKVLGKSGRPRFHASDADRKLAFRRRERIKLLIEQGTIVGQDLLDGAYPNLAESVRAGMQELAGLDSSCELQSRGWLQSAGSVFASKFDTTALNIDYTDDDAFVDLLCSLHQRVVERKEDAGLLAPAYFDAGMTAGTNRGLANVRAVRGVWLDNDGGDLSPAEFATIFPAWRIVVWNTFSSTPERLRWRAFIPTTDAMSVKVYDFVLQEIVAVLNKKGYWAKHEVDEGVGRKVKVHGFDPATMTASSLFYLPCQARHPKGSFYSDFNEPARSPLEPAKLIKRPIKHPNPPRLRPKPIPAVADVCGGGFGVEEERVLLKRQPRRAIEAAARSDWRFAANTPGKGHEAFYLLARQLWNGSYSKPEIEAILRSEAGNSRSPHERRSEISHILNGLK